MNKEYYWHKGIEIVKNSVFSLLNQKYCINKTKC